MHQRFESLASLRFEIAIRKSRLAIHFKHWDAAKFRKGLRFESAIQNRGGTWAQFPPGAPQRPLGLRSWSVQRRPPKFPILAEDNHLGNSAGADCNLREPGSAIFEEICGDPEINKGQKKHINFFSPTQKPPILGPQKKVFVPRFL